MPDEDNGDDDALTDIIYCCCDTDLCNNESNGAEGMYFSVFGIAFTLTLIMVI